MISREQYIEYKRLVDEYEQAEFEEGTRQAEEDLDFDDEDDKETECEWCGQALFQCKCEAAMNCTCGAYTKNGVHVADCICGAG
jgi:hypothetical protein